MYNSFKQYLHNIRRRGKKILWLLILLPILTAGIAYFLSANTPTSYKTSSTIKLGNFQNTQGFTDPAYLSNEIPSEPYLTSLNNKYDLDINPEQLSSSLTVTEGAVKKTIVFSLDGRNSADLEKTLDKITSAFLSEGTTVYKEKQNLQIESFEKLDKIPPEHPGYATAQKELLEIGKERADSKNSYLLEEVSSSPVSLISPANKAFLGFLLGLFLSLTILVVPEIFRK
ncbi:hypothetical protein ELQ35_03535 [Peribacillus cavernae]|uniref:Polysaccharide chain length determinant N-terminal domain-containing protein n=1 Tax=Peribacillus cavernae TaxID=1674310 RepID=A0A433HSX7_9BACI|nr:hypothetical protein [Peribacillus cavernae]MDQ0218431.1 capsular polysaccharide biosynthesis protein [Peribacillus cavernae]RUQ31433.1 hypothetical protein ELQ35_03535 [Peribacillus cavernae]